MKKLYVKLVLMANNKEKIFQIKQHLEPLNVGNNTFRYMWTHASWNTYDAYLLQYVH